MSQVELLCPVGSSLAQHRCGYGMSYGGGDIYTHAYAEGNGINVQTFLILCAGCCITKSNLEFGHLQKMLLVQCINVIVECFSVGVQGENCL